mgnify:CR=1 FL=1
MKTHTRGKPLKCNICTKTFYQKSHLSQHIMTHTREKTFKCMFCTEAFSHKKVLSGHIMSDTGDKPFKCNFFYQRINSKEYFKIMNLEDARTKFKMRTEMLNFKFNYKSDYENFSSLWKCDSCLSAIETQNHILWCPSYAELREGKDIMKDEDVIDYFQKVIKIRDNLKITK